MPIAMHTYGFSTETPFDSEHFPAMAQQVERTQQRKKGKLTAYEKARNDTEPIPLTWYEPPEPKKQVTHSIPKIPRPTTEQQPTRRYHFPHKQPLPRLNKATFIQYMANTQPLLSPSTNGRKCSRITQWKEDLYKNKTITEYYPFELRGRGKEIQHIVPKAMQTKTIRPMTINWTI